MKISLIAELNILHCDQPTDDPLASGLDKSENEFVAVCELGGGILVISILQFQKEMFQVKSIKRGKGDKYFDLALLWNAEKEFKKYTH